MSYASSFIRNTCRYVAHVAVDALSLRPHAPPPSERVLFRFNDPKMWMKQWGIGCDQDIGGHSVVRFGPTSDGKARFSGTISMALDPTSPAVYTGYAACRSVPGPRQHLFDTRTIDCSRYSFLKMRLRGDHRTYAVNFATPHGVSGDLFSCKFKFLKPYEWEDIIIPFDYFIKTNCGVEYLRQSEPNMEKIKSFGLLLADNLPGPFSIDLDSISLMNLLPSSLASSSSSLSESNSNSTTITHTTRSPVESDDILKHLHDPTKVRSTSSSASPSLRKDVHFGFGTDLGPGMIQSPDDSSPWVNPTPERVVNEDWIVKVAPSSPIKKRTRHG